jgi:hypothetical protein
MEIGTITAGPASILSTIEGREAQEFQVEVNRVYRDSGGTHAMFSVTDPALLSRTGGIVQGMSGSPILQDGKLVGAVTHVSVRPCSPPTNPRLKEHSSRNPCGRTKPLFIYWKM